MSYVIQNFYNWNQFYILTPRFKFLFYLINIDKFFFFLKLNFSFAMFNRFNLYAFQQIFFFFKFFFVKRYIKILFQLNLNFINNYDNQLTRSAVFWIYKNILNFLNKKNLLSNDCLLSYYNNSFYNQYWYAIKILNIQINKNYYKNVFFYFMLFWPFLWYQWHNSIIFYLNFIFINYYFQLSRFYNNYFLKIYSF